MDVLTLLKSVAVGSEVKRITGSTSDSAFATGLSAWVESVSGDAPIVQKYGDNKVKLVLDKQQVKNMQYWLDKQLQDIIYKRGKGKVSLELGPVITPVALKYAIPVILSAVAIGFFIGRKI